MEATPGDILGILFSLGIWPLVIYGIIRGIWKRFYLKIPETYKLKGPAPKGGVLCGQFGIGKMKFNNLISVLEQGEILYLRMPFGPGFGIPFTDIASVDKKNIPIRRVQIHVNLKNNQLPRIDMVIKQSQESQFPQLLGVQTNEILLSNPFQASSGPVQNQPYKDSNAFRVVLLLGVLIAFVAFILFQL